MSGTVNEPNRNLSVKSAAVTDRGLSPKRPLNEDSFLADGSRGVFAVADGVGGAEAGEVASQTAIEVLDEAFRHQVDGADVEDLMELAIQRANASIHQMARDHAKFSMMATTIVGLHLDGNRATIGHVGDSRLYRLTPTGQLLRETEDHSVVEEEVRAGRMTAEQAANHPSKNVISRALGAEDSVEVDMKVIEVDDGTEFLLCTDGITRHIPDPELQQLLITHDDLAAACAEMKRRCFERGAEDNLTAVLVSVGTPISARERAEDLDQTESPDMAAARAAAGAAWQTTLESPVADAPQAASPAFVAASRKAFPAVSASATDAPASGLATLNIPPAPGKSGVERTMTRFFLFVLLLAAVAGAFYAGRRYKGTIPYADQGAIAVADASPTATPLGSAFLSFENARREVDSDPNAWLANRLPLELTRQGIPDGLQSREPEFLYLLGRASLLTANYETAMRAFESAIANISPSASSEGATLRKEAALGLAAVALRFEAARPAAATRLEEELQQPSPSAPDLSPSGTPLSAPFSSP